MKILNCLIILLILNTSTFAQPKQLKNFNQVLENLTSGKNVKIVIHYEKCRLIIDDVEVPAPKVIGGMEIKAFEYFSKGVIGNDEGYISTSESILISHSHFGYILNYVKIRIYENNNIEILVRYLDPITYKVEMQETFYTELMNDDENNAVFLFSY